MSETSRSRNPNRYSQIIERIFLNHYSEGEREFTFEREEIEQVAGELQIKVPKNVGDVVYSFRYRNELPAAIRERALEGESWIILPAGKARYRFALEARPSVVPNPLIAETKIPDSTPGVITKYALSDEQALLAKLRYNRLIDIFTGVACYSLQNHLRTTVTDMGQVETDEIYIGVDKRGVHYVLQSRPRVDLTSSASSKSCRTLASRRRSSLHLSAGRSPRSSWRRT